MALRPKRLDIEREKRSRKFDSILIAIHILFVVFIAFLLIYLFFIQVVDLKHYRVRAKSQRVGRIFSMRGDIFDRNGIKLATDKVFSDVYAHPADYDKSPEELAKTLAPVLKMPKEELLLKLKKNGPVITLAKDIDRTTAREITKLHLREVSLGKKNTREYPQGSLAAHVLGYYNFDADTSTGVEYSAKDKLEHVSNGARYQHTRDGKIIYDFATDPIATTTNPKGENITLTIDAAIQHVCEKELAKMVKERSALRGTVIVMNPRNGEILAYAVAPTYDPNNFKKATPLQVKNWTITDVFPPGSTFKIITLASAMELGKIDEETKVLDTGKMKIGDWEILNYDYNTRPYPGNISMEYLLEHSSNIGSVKVAETMSSKEFYDMLKKFGFGTKSGIDLSGESSGLLKPWQQWDKSMHASMSYGYGTSISAMQMVSAVAALANNGVRVTPHVIKYSEAEAEKKIKKVQVVSPETAKTMTKLLTSSINKSRSNVKLASYNVAAKTGTSHKPKENGKGYTEELYTSTIGYLPSSDPQLLVYVMIDGAKGGGVWGNTVAGPVFYEVATQSARILNLKPDRTSN